MADPFLGEIRMFGGNFAPAGWHFCDGSLLAISQNNALFALLGTTYGGDGIQSFGLPSLAGRFPLHPSGTIPQGEISGAESVTLNTTHLPSHSHPLLATSSTGTKSSPSGNYFAASGAQMYVDPASASPVPMNAKIGGTTGGNQPHDNMPPYLCVSFIIALEGIFPARN